MTASSQSRARNSNGTFRSAQPVVKIEPTKGWLFNEGGKMTRANDLARKFQIGSKVTVSKALPLRDEWPGVQRGMSQFFCGEELTVLDVYPHPARDDLLAVVLGTAGNGASVNFSFSADWLTPAKSTEVKVTPLQSAVKRQAAAKAKLHVAMIDSTKTVEVKPEPVAEKHPPVEAPAKESAGLGVGLGAALGGAFAASLLTAFSNKRKAAKKDELNLLEAHDDDETEEKVYETVEEACAALKV